MHSPTLCSLLLAVGVLGGPVLDTRDLPNGVAAHHHKHMAFHLNKARQAGVPPGDTPAEAMMSELSMLQEESQGNKGAGPPNPAPPAPSPSPSPSAPAPVAEKIVVVHQTQNNQPSPQPEKPKPVVHQVQQQQPPKSQPQPQPVVHQAQQQPPKSQPQPQPVVHQAQQEAPKTHVSKPEANAPSASSVSTDGLPTTLVENLDPASEIYKGLATLHHNIHRTNHSLPELTWNDTLLEYAKETATSCIYGHSLTPGGGGYGQNIAAGNPPGNVSADITNGFYNSEIGLFQQAIGEWGNNSPDMADFEHWGHATQMLWKETTSFACYTASCSPPGQDPAQCDPSGQSYLQNVGCRPVGSSATATAAFNLVCNYYPPGNYQNEYSSVPAPQDKVGFVQMTENGVTGL